MGLIARSCSKPDFAGGSQIAFELPVTSDLRGIVELVRSSMTALRFGFSSQTVELAVVPWTYPVMMKLRLASVAALFLTVCLGRAQTTQEWKLDLSKYGVVKSSCVWYPGHLEFLDDDHLVVSAPVAYSCDKSNRDKATDTRITVIDLQGHELASIRRTDVVELTAAPIEYVAVCAGDRVELLSRNLQVAWSVALSTVGQSWGCFFDGRLSPSRTAILIPGPRKSQSRLYRGSSSDPIAEITTSKGQGVRALAAADDGFLVCTKESKQCEVVGSLGVVRSFPMPELGGASGYSIVGLVAPDKLLLVGFDGKRLDAETPTGEMVSMGDVAKLKPPFIDSLDAQMSAVEPRRILYRVDGCLLGDFDDCYGVVFRRFAVFDSQTSRMLFRHNYASGADLKISQNGHIVMEHDGAEVHLFRIP